jgi:catechol 2,3-dioxygenase-like lactoylglutathione lyase family enzyme
MRDSNELIQVQGVSHITFIVRDLNLMARFLCEGLGASEVYDSREKNFSLSREKFFDLGGIWIAAMEGEPPAERSYRHLALKISEPDVPVLEARLRALGVEVKPPRGCSGVEVTTAVSREDAHSFYESVRFERTSYRYYRDLGDNRDRSDDR